MTARPAGARRGSHCSSDHAGAFDEPVDGNSRPSPLRQMRALAVEFCLRLVGEPMPASVSVSTPGPSVDRSGCRREDVATRGQRHHPALESLGLRRKAHLYIFAASQLRERVVDPFQRFRCRVENTNERDADIGEPEHTVLQLILPAKRVRLVASLNGAIRKELDVWVA